MEQGVNRGGMELVVILVLLRVTAFNETAGCFGLSKRSAGWIGVIQ